MRREAAEDYTSMANSGWWIEAENYVGKVWSGLSALDVIVADYLGRWPRLVWDRVVGAWGEPE